MLLLDSNKIVFHFYQIIIKTIVYILQLNKNFRGLQIYHLTQLLLTKNNYILV